MFSAGIAKFFQCLVLFIYSLLPGLTLLLSPACGTWFSNLNLPLPGHVLVYGPPVSLHLQHVTFMHFSEKNDKFNMQV